MNIRIPQNTQSPICDTHHIVPMMQQVLKRENKRSQKKEHFWVIGLSNHHQLLYLELVALGNIDSVAVNPSEVLEQAAAKGAMKLVLVHNHPSGNPQPSQEDQLITDRLIQAAKLLRKQILDHIIITPTGYFSFYGSGLMEKLEQSLTYVVPYELEQQSRKDKAIESAKAMLKDQMPVSKIRKYTQLSQREINKLKEELVIIESG